MMSADIVEAFDAVFGEGAYERVRKKIYGIYKLQAYAS
jgi:hypothetical protein